MKNINYLDPPPPPPPPPPPRVSGSIPPWSIPPPPPPGSGSVFSSLGLPVLDLVLRTFTCSTDSDCSLETSVFSVNHLARILHTLHAEPRGALRQLLTPLVVFIFQGLPRHHVRLRDASYESCRASRCTQATYESTLSPTHLMQQLLAFVHPLLKFSRPL